MSMSFLALKKLKFADYCLVMFMLTMLVFVRARIGFISAYTLFPLWILCTWGINRQKLVKDRHVSRVLGMTALFFGVILTIRALYGFDFPMTVLLVKNYVAAFFGWLAFAYYMKTGQEGKLRLFALIMLGVVMANALWNLSIESDVAFASRAATGGMLERQMDKGGGVNWDLADALTSGVVSFYGMVSTALLIPVAFYVARYSGRYAPLFLGFAVVSFFAVLRASYMLCLIYIGIGMYLAIIGFQRVVQLKYVWWVSLIVGAVLFMTVLAMADPLISAMEGYSSRKENEIYATKLRDISTAVQTNDMSYFPRIQNYLISIKTIRGRGLFGAGFDGGRTLTGGHSEILDLLAQVGIVGFLPYIALFVCLEGFYRANVEGRSRYVRNLRYIFWVPLMVASFTNPTKGYEIWFSYFFTVPALSFWMQPRYRAISLAKRGPVMTGGGECYEGPRAIA